MQFCPGCSPRTTRSRLSGNIKLDLDDPGGRVDTGPLLSGQRLRLDDLGWPLTKMLGLHITAKRDLGGSAGVSPEPDLARVGRLSVAVALQPEPCDDDAVPVEINATRGEIATFRGEHMSVIGWIVLGIIAGFIASKIVNRRGEGLILDIVLGIVGGVVGGWLFTFFGAEEVTGFNLYSMLVAIIGAVVVLFVYHAIAGRRVVP